MEVPSSGPAQPTKPCRFFQQGDCRHGAACKFSHSPSATATTSAPAKEKQEPAPAAATEVVLPSGTVVKRAAPGNKTAKKTATKKTEKKPASPQPSSLKAVAAESPKPVPVASSPTVEAGDGTFAYVSNATFLKAPLASSASKIVLAGVCWDGATTNRSGARLGPAGIRRASHMLCDGEHALFNISPLEPRFHFGDAGDFSLPNTSLERMRTELIPKVLGLLNRYQHAVFLGGDHSITLPILRAYRAHFGRPLAVLHFDAHCDTWKDHFGEPSGHGTWVYEAIQENLVEKECFFQIGIRSSGNREAREYVRNVGGMVFTSRELRGLENKEQLGGVIRNILNRHKQRNAPPIYLSLDIDCLDPAFAPGTGTPEPGGMTTSQVLTLLEELVPSLPFVGADFVEVAPAYDHAELTSLAAAHFCHTYLCAVMKK